MVALMNMDGQNMWRELLHNSVQLFQAGMLTSACIFNNI